MDIDELQSRLRRLGVDIPQNTLKRWAYDGMIPRPRRYKKGKGKGKGRAVSWDRTTIADAAALWAVRNACHRKLLPSKKRIDVIKRAVSHVYEGPPFAYDITSIMTGATWQSVKPNYVGRGFPDLSLFPGRKPSDRSDVLNALVVVWICAREKARRGKPIKHQFHVLLNWKSVNVALADASKSTEQFGLDYVFEKTTIEASDRDEVIRCINGVDVRKLYFPPPS